LLPAPPGVVWQDAAANLAARRDLRPSRQRWV